MLAHVAQAAYEATACGINCMAVAASPLCPALRLRVPGAPDTEGTRPKPRGAAPCKWCSLAPFDAVSRSFVLASALQSRRCHRAGACYRRRSTC